MADTVATSSHPTPVDTPSHLTPAATLSHPTLVVTLLLDRAATATVDHTENNGEQNRKNKLFDSFEHISLMIVLDCALPFTF